MNVVVEGIDRDDGNRAKCQKHGLSTADVEHVLANGESVIVPGRPRGGIDARLIAIGRTKVGRYAFVVFTHRDKAGMPVLRPISARYMHEKEVRRYEQEIARLPKR